MARRGAVAGHVVEAFALRPVAVDVPEVLGGACSSEQMTPRALDASGRGFGRRVSPKPLMLCAILALSASAADARRWASVQGRSQPLEENRQSALAHGPMYRFLCASSSRRLMSGGRQLAIDEGTVCVSANERIRARR